MPTASRCHSASLCAVCSRMCARGIGNPPPPPAPFLVALRGGKFEVSSQFSSGVELGPTGHPKAGDTWEFAMWLPSRGTRADSPPWDRKSGFGGRGSVCGVGAAGWGWNSSYMPFLSDKTKEGCFSSGGRPPAWWCYERDERVVGVILEGPVQFTAVQQSASGIVVGARSSAARQEYTVHAYRRLHPS